MGVVFGFLTPFYGIPVLARSLIRAGRAWHLCRSALLFLDVFVQRHSPPSSPLPTSTALSPAERLPTEVWLLIRQALIDHAVQEAELYSLRCMQATCPSCGDYDEHPDYSTDGVGLLIGELWPGGSVWAVGEDGGENFRPCRKCGTFVPPQDINWAMDNELGFWSRPVKTLQHFLSLYGLHLPTPSLHEQHIPCINDKPADKTLVSFVGLPPVDRIGFSQLGWEQATINSGALVTLDTTALPADADRRIMKVVDEWQLEAMEVGTRTYRVEGGEGGAEEQTAVRPRWRVFGVSGEDD